MRDSSEFFFKEVVGLRSEARTTMVEGSQAVQGAELALSQLEGRLSLRGVNVAMSPVLEPTRTGGVTAHTASGAYWEAAVDDLPFGQLQGDGGLTSSSSDLNALSPVNCVSQAEVWVWVPGRVLGRPRSSRSSVVSRISSMREFVNAHNDIDWAAREAEGQIQSEEIYLRDSTVAAQLQAQREIAQVRAQAQVAAAQAQAQAQAAAAVAAEAANAIALVEAEAQERARAVEATEARSRISLELRRFEIQATKKLDHAQLDNEEAEEERSIHGLGSNGTDRWVRDSRAGQADNSEINQGGPFEDLVISTSSGNAQLPPSNEIDPSLNSFPFSLHRLEGIIPATIGESSGIMNDHNDTRKR
jgi:hypothetical protein